MTAPESKKIAAEWASWLGFSERHESDAWIFRRRFRLPIPAAAVLSRDPASDGWGGPPTQVLAQPIRINIRAIDTGGPLFDMPFDSLKDLVEAKRFARSVWTKWISAAQEHGNVSGGGTPGVFSLQAYATANRWSVAMMNYLGTLVPPYGVHHYVPKKDPRFLVVLLEIPDSDLFNSMFLRKTPAALRLGPRFVLLLGTSETH